MVAFDYLPKKGTRITVNNSVEGIISSQSFYSNLLKIWMGRQPPSDKFQDELFVRPSIMG
jgi:hypothetical protein